MIQYARRCSETPYYIKEINMQVNSLEEINYFVYNHMNLVYREFFCDELFDYMENELKAKALAGQLRIMQRAGADLKSLISYLLKESFYYDAADLSRISAFVMNINNISEGERLKIEGDGLFRERKYNAARAVYMKILTDEPEKKKGEFYADIAFSVGLCYANLFLCKNACHFFNLAYDIFPGADYARACVYLSVALKDDEELLASIIKYKISDEELARIRSDVSRTRAETVNSKNFLEYSQYVSKKDTAQREAGRRKEEYYRMTE